MTTTASQSPDAARSLCDANAVAPALGRHRIGGLLVDIGNRRQPGGRARGDGIDIGAGNGTGPDEPQAHAILHAETSSKFAAAKAAIWLAI